MGKNPLVISYPLAYTVGMQVTVTLPDAANLSETNAQGSNK